MVAALVALVPVLIFLALLVVLDSFKLVKTSAVATAIGAGMAAAVLAVPLTRGAEALLHLSPSLVVRYAGPLLEETLKLVLIAVLLHRKRIGFPVDAAVLGFAVGAGFALVENLVFLRALNDATLTLWLVRGLGTAILHGGTTSIAAMIAKCTPRPSTAPPAPQACAPSPNGPAATPRHSLPRSPSPRSRVSVLA